MLQRLRTLEVQSPGDNDSVSHVQVRIRFYLHCGFYFGSYLYFSSYPSFCFYFFSILILKPCFFSLLLMDFVSWTGSWNINLIHIFSRVRSHFFPVIGRQQSNYARICCFFRVISISLRIRSHFFVSGPTFSCPVSLFRVRSHFFVSGLTFSCPVSLFCVRPHFLVSGLTFSKL